MNNKNKNKDLVSLNIDETKDFLSHIVRNNRYIQAEGKIPVSVEVVGDSGIGKTSAIIQLAEELDLDFIKLNLAQIEELGDLVGFPIRQFELTKGEESEWVDESVLDSYIKRNYEPTGNNRMSYCAPEWISGRKRGGILLLDDWNRADARFIQALMELIDRQQYISWKLPTDWHIILTSNPDNGDYSVNSLDNAQKTRMISINLKFDIKCWSVWAEANKIDSRCINFMIMNPELITTKVNSRSVSMFFNSISSIKSFEDKISLIQMIGEGSAGSEFSSMFTSFINNKLDRIISPNDIIFHKDKEHVIKTLKGLVGKTGDKYRGDIASTIATRLINYVIQLSEKSLINTDAMDRLIAVLLDENIFTNDIKYNIVKSVYSSNTVKFRPLTQNKDLVKYLIS